MTAPEFIHETVLLDAVREALSPRSGGLYADVTLGGGGHAEAILAASGPDGRLIGIDRDPVALDHARARLAEYWARADFYEAVASALPVVLEGRRLDGLVADLGVSSPQLDDPARGLSFRHAGPLDMRMGPDARTTAWSLVRDLRETQLADVIYQYGDERASRPIARSIKRMVEAGTMETTKDLAAAVHKVLGPPRYGKNDPATRTFQALRIAVNDELGELERLLKFLPQVLADGGVVAIISFHSLEDRMVKHTLRETEALEVLTRKPVEPSPEECARNPRARSARLRIARRRGREEFP